ncbi:right-handed parallel beta-helix repeat-containing protein [Pseudoalteromonas denitrificans]|uniref:Right handed beta helix region n=1 Tax=Pseudoalteromonas denitrificans DSM 6059 TaxID=1123010 RepID=A0A1I1SJD8_9GAMM|nr:right-handed parallel beta-helix repeat-containing protein [Pseudoalteromonas denitrificans]SFD46422.1 Right handed beta helix region [Pseudoalteromonas denitrificans DSM 6059]
MKIKLSPVHFLAISSLLIATTTTASESEDCGCDYTLPSSHYAFDGATQGISVGQTLCLAPGKRGPIKLSNIHGAKDSPITVKNCGGVVETTPYHYAISIQNSTHMNLSGTGDESNYYGIRLGGTLGIEKRSSDIEVNNIEIYRANFAGIMAKTDPTCELNTQAGHFTLANLNIHHNWIHNTQNGEGMYLGYTGKYRTLTCDGTQQKVYPHDLQGLRVHNNLVHNTAAEGIQANSLTEDILISDNRVSLYGQAPFAIYQNNGVQIGGDNVVLQNNVIDTGSGNGVIAIGKNITINSNTIINAGSYGIFADNRPENGTIVGQAGLAHQYLNNTIIDSAQEGIRSYVRLTSNNNLVHGNTIINDGLPNKYNEPKFIHYLNNDVLRDEQNNHHIIRK